MMPLSKNISLDSCYPLKPTEGLNGAPKVNYDSQIYSGSLYLWTMEGDILQLNLELERQLAAEALARGIALELYAQSLLQEAMASRSKGRSRASQEEFRVFLDALASKAPNLTQLQSETFSREMIYGEHA